MASLALLFAGWSGDCAWGWGATSRVWETGGTALTAPALAADGSIYVGALTNGSAALFSFAADGGTNWVLPLWGNRICRGPAIGLDGRIYMGSSSNSVYNYAEFYAVSPSGVVERLWPLKNWNDSSPAVDWNGTVYMVDVYNCWSFDPGGRTNWSFRSKGWLAASPAIATNGAVYIAELYAFAGGGSPRVVRLRQDGTEDGQWLTLGRLWYGPALDETGAIYISDEDGRIYSLAEEGGVNWISPLPAGVLASLAIGSNGLLYAGCTDSNLYALSVEDGSVTQSWEAGGSIRTTPTLGSDGTVYVGADDSNVYAFASGGATVCVWNTAGIVRSSPALGTNGVLYVGSDDGNLYAFAATGELARAPWPKFGHDTANTGGFAPGPPLGVQASDGRYRDRIRLDWQPVPRATSYAVWRSSTGAPEDAVRMWPAVTDTQFDDPDAEIEIPYTYWVRAVNVSGSGDPSDPDAGWRRREPGGGILFTR